MSTLATNDVWATINKTIDAVKDYKLGKLQSQVFASGAPQATAAPSGNVGGTAFNPLPWQWFSANPQAEAKAAPSQASMFGGAAMGGWLVLAAVVVVVLALLRR